MCGGQIPILSNEVMKALGMPDVIIDGEVIEANAPRRLVQTWRLLMDPGMAAEGFTRLMYEIQQARGGVTNLTVTHDVTGAPKLTAMFAGEGESTVADAARAETRRVHARAPGCHHVVPSGNRPQRRRPTRQLAVPLVSGR